MNRVQAVQLMVIGTGLAITIAMNACNSTPEGLSLGSGESALASSKLEAQMVFDGTTGSTRGKTEVEVIPETPWQNIVIDTPIKYACSSHFNNNERSSLTQTTNVEVQVRKLDGTVMCRQNTNVYANLINHKLLKITSCENLPNGQYEIKIMAPDLTTRVDGGNMLVAGNGYVQPDLLFVTKQTDKFFFSAKNVPDVAIQPEVWVLYQTDHSKDVLRATEKCEVIGSPLVVDTHAAVENAQAVQLSAPTDGIMFNIFGWNALPTANTPKRISWVQNFNRYKFLVLADANGKVLGVDQMFGDNTLGPDGKFATNGFTALAKYDGKDAWGRRQIRAADGKIDASDDVYSRLSLWADRNMNGKVEAGELTSLRDAGLTEIDLNYDPNFKEEDRYGNRTELKSVVSFADGRKRLIFDLWFRALDK
ncbi:MAG: hypothetical protein KF681_07605 [Bdellovibrionaceae bacterium]|nr:hypothetical protein [Pseudobdellovibrionaceae bacterium]